jgi:hypothetical protein
MARTPPRGPGAPAGVAKPRRPACLPGAFAFALLTGHAAATEYDNNVLAASIGAATGVHNPAFGFSLVAKPPASLIAEGITLSSGIAQKAIPAVLVTPTDRSRYPNTPDDCHFRFDLPQSTFLFSDLYGVVKTSAFGSSFDMPVVANPLTGIPDDWGELGTPEVIHQNAEVRLSALNPYVEFDEGSQQVELPAGRHTVTWQADTLIDPVFDIAVPTALLGLGIFSYLKAPAFKAALEEDAAKAASELSGFKKALYKLFQPDEFTKFSRSARAGALAVDRQTGQATEFVAARHERQQQFTVFDVLPPVLDVIEPVIELEATDFGGVLYERVRSDVRATVTASDPCGRPVTLGNDIGSLLRVGQNAVTWTATDLGPTPSDGRNSVSAAQTIVVRDTQAPILVPPAGRVIEVAPGTTSLARAEIDLGAPMVVDLADPTPTITSDAPDDFFVGSRTPVTWSATDDGYPTPNTSTAEQLITVKAAGTNTAPRVGDQTLSTLTSQPIDIVLSGIDDDFLDGRYDPLAFEIVERPANGEFVAPLYPFFIEDYRTSPGGPYGEDFYLSNNRSNWLYDNVCNVPPYNSMPYSDRLRVDWVYAPRFIHVTDDGTAFIIDAYWRCGPSTASTNPRISKWDADGNFLAQTDYNGTTDAFVMDQDGMLYVINRSGGGSSTQLSLSQVDPELDSAFAGDLWIFTSNDTGDDPVSNAQYSYARVDSRRGLIYLNDRRRVFVYDVRDQLTNGTPDSVNGMLDRYLGALNGGAQFINTEGGGWFSSWTGFAMEVDSQGNLYVADTAGHRIHKFSASGFDAEGNFVPGEYIGWMGRCSASTNKACDADRGISKGYSCTDATCSVASIGERAGDQPGQFDNPVYLALDPNDTLYVADYGNSRVQRFAPDGSFAGEAVSTGTGVNRGTNPGFVLGNMGQPKSVSVNSTQFYVIDTDESFVHVFETSPFKDISDDSVTVTYVSNFAFHSARDSFRYRASDGLADSGAGTINIDVARNFRAPLAFDSSVHTDEDTAVELTLVADDPDGIAGQDFNGLDTLSYEVVALPEHGTLSGSGETRTYTPDADFHGSDSFRFKVNDGLDDSNLATVTIEVAPVNDPPVVTEIALPARVGRGFPVLLDFTFADDGSGIPYYTAVSWGSGESTVETGDFVDPDGDGGEPPALEGLKVIAPVGGVGEGSVLGQYVYTEAGSRNLNACIQDDAGITCRQQAVEIEEVVHFDLRLTAPLPEEKTTIIDNDDLALTISVRNAQPEGFAGLWANGVQLQQRDTGNLQVTGITSQPGGCSLVAGVLDCDIGSLAPDQAFTVDITVARRHPVVFDSTETLQFELTTTSHALHDNYPAAINIELAAPTADRDGDGMSDAFETAYGFDPDNPADAAGNGDGDALSNLEEFQRRTNPRLADSDGDSLSDSAEVAAGTDPLSADSDNDGIDDGVERAFGLNPRDLYDAEQDPDGDGLSNAEETRRGTRIDLADSDGDGVGDAVDNCALTRNATQLDSDGDHAGDACDNDDDNDGLPDSVEMDAGLDTTDPGDARTDKDGDGLSNLEEYRLGFDIGKTDSDGDGIDDLRERNLRILPVLQSILD